VRRAFPRIATCPVVEVPALPGERRRRKMGAAMSRVTQVWFTDTIGDHREIKGPFSLGESILEP
jgi:hypothetical protein